MASNVLAELLVSVKGQTSNFDRSMDRLDDTLTQIGVSAIDTERKLDRLEDAFLELAVATLDTNKGLDRVAAGLEKAGEKSRKSSEDTDRVADSYQRLGSAASSIGLVLGGVGAALTGISALSVKTAIDQQSAFTGVEKTFSGTREQLEGLRSQLLDLSEQIPVSFEDLSAIAEIGGQLGIAGEDLATFTETIAKLGAATNLAGEEGAQALARLIGITGLANDQISNVGSAIVELGNNSRTSEKEIANMALRLAGAGTAAGISAPDILGIATALSSVGIEAEAGGSAFSRLISQIQVAVSTGGADLEEFAKVARVSTKEFAKAFRENGAGAIELFLQGLRRTQDESGDLIGTLEDLGIKELRLRDAITRTALDVKSFAGFLELSNDAFRENTALNKEAAARFDDVREEFTKLGSAVSNLAASLGTTLLPAIGDVVRGTTKIVTSMREWADAHPQLASAIAGLAGAIGVGATAGGGLLFGMAQVISLAADLKIALGATGTAGLAGAATRAAEAIKALNLSLSVGAIGKIGGIALAAAGAVFFLSDSLVKSAESAGVFEAQAAKAEEQVALLNERFTGFHPPDPQALGNSADGIQSIVEAVESFGAESGNFQRSAGAIVDAVASFAKPMGEAGAALKKLPPPETTKGFSALAATVAGLDSPFASFKLALDKTTGAITKSTASFDDYESTLREILRLRGLQAQFDEDSDAAKLLEQSIGALQAQLEKYSATVSALPSFADKAIEGIPELEDGLRAVVGLTPPVVTLGDGITAMGEAAENAARRAKSLEGAVEDGVETLGDYKDEAEKIADQLESFDENLERLGVSMEDTGATIGRQPEVIRQVSTAIDDLSEDMVDLVFEGGKLIDIFESFGKTVLRIVGNQIMGKLIAQFGKLISAIPGLGGIGGTLTGAGGGGGSLFGLSAGASNAVGAIGLGGLVGAQTLGGVSGGLIGGGAALAGLATASTLGIGGTALSLGALGGPVGIAIGGAIAAGATLFKVFSKNAIEKFTSEFERDFGGVQIGKDFANTLLAQLGVAENQIGGIRKDLASAPATLLSALPIAQAQGKLDEFLESLESVGTVFGDVNLRSALEFGLATNDFSALNEAFRETFGNSTELVRIFGEELTPLLVDMQARGFTPLADRVRELADQGLSLEEIFVALRPELVQQIALSQQLGVELDPLITQFADLVGNTEDLTDRQVLLLAALSGLRGEPERVAASMATLAGEVTFLREQGATTEEIVRLLGDALIQAGQAATELGVEVPPVVQDIIDLATAAEDAGESVETLSRSLGTLSDQEAAQLGLDRFRELLNGAVDDARTLATSWAAAVGNMVANGIDLQTAAERSLGLFGDQIIEAVNLLTTLGEDIPPQLQVVIAQLENLGLIEIDDLGFVTLAESIDDAAEAAGNLTQALTPFQAGLERGRQSVQQLGQDANTLAGQFTGVVEAMLSAGVDSAAAIEVAFDEFGRQLVDAFNELRRFGQDAPAELANLIGLLDSLGFIDIDASGFARLADAATDAGDAAVAAGDEAARAAQRQAEAIEAARTEWNKLNAEAQKAQADRLRETADNLAQASGTVNQQFIAQLRASADRFDAVAADLLGEGATAAPTAATPNRAARPGEDVPLRSRTALSEDAQATLDQLIGVQQAVNQSTTAVDRAATDQVTALGSLSALLEGMQTQALEIGDANALALEQLRVDLNSGASRQIEVLERIAAASEASAGREQIVVNVNNPRFTDRREARATMDQVASEVLRVTRRF